MRFKIIFFSSLVLFFSLFIVNYYFIRSDYKKSNIERQNKRLDIIKKFSIIIREAFIRNDNDILDIENFLKFIKKTNSDISYIYVFDKDGKIIATNYIKKEKFNHIKLKYVFSKKVVNDFFVDKKFYLNDEYKKSNILYKDYFLINNNQLINEFTYFVTFNRDLISIIKIGFMDTEIKRAYFLNSKTFAYKDLRISISLFILGIMAFFLITYRVNNFIADLKKAIKFLGEGKFDTRINFDYEGEFKELASEFNKMAARLKEIDILKQDFISN
ncbi:MAG: hypothetical protein LBF97_06850, partial [Elusimicrobiota bacterium]|nr:hypothetical protein [Elusimicrobiota bacterium]